MDKPAAKAIGDDKEVQQLEYPITQSDSISPGQSREERRLLWKQDIALVVILSGCFFFAYLVP